MRDGEHFYVALQDEFYVDVRVQGFRLDRDYLMAGAARLGVQELRAGTPGGHGAVGSEQR